MRMRHTVICGLPRSSVFFPHYLKKGTIFENLTEHEMCLLLISSTIFA